jgi:hypothetical protein
MRRFGLIVVMMVSLTGCGTFGGGGDKAPESKGVDHVILYDLHALGGGPGFLLTVNYTDVGGGQATEQPSSPTWTHELTLRYPDVTRVAFGGAAIPDPANPPGAVAPPQVECVLWVDGDIVDQAKGYRPTCQAELTATAKPIPTVSPS